MNSNTFRNFVINLLDDEHGISIDNYKELVQLVKNYSTLSEGISFNHIWHTVETCEGRVFLNENDAAELRRVANLVVDAN
jgi:hypothetical protein